MYTLVRVRLALFDIDGTLIRLEPAFDDCFEHAVATVLGDNGFSRRWFEDYPHVTDSGIVATILGRAPTPDEDARIQDLYIQELVRAGGRTEPIPGAARFLAALSDAGWRLALGTGNWARAARWKLSAAGLALDHLPLGSADDAPERKHILRAAIERAGGEPEARAVYFGDGDYDRRAATAADIGFVHVGEGKELSDYTDIDEAMALTILRSNERSR